MAMDLDVIAKGIGGVASVVGAGLALRRAGASFLDSKPARRSTLKADADLLEKLPRDSPAYSILANNLEERIRTEYPSKAYPLTPMQKRPRQREDWSNIVVGSLVLIGFAGWTAYLVRNGFTPWALLTGFFAFGGLGLLVDGITQKRPGSGRSPADA
jgi:hypothetical protein